MELLSAPPGASVPRGRRSLRCIRLIRDTCKGLRLGGLLTVNPSDDKRGHRLLLRQRDCPITPSVWMALGLAHQHCPGIVFRLLRFVAEQS